MIDVVFVIMLFFMVMAGALRVEKHHGISLPRLHGEQPNDPLPMEAVIRVEQDGEISLNDEVLDSADTSTLPELSLCLSQLKESTHATHSPLVVTIDANDHACYQRIIDVLDALSRAQIATVTFTAQSPE